jgi:hypothetical protein
VKHMKWARVAAVALSAVLLTGCAGPGMGVASKVGTVKITNDETAKAADLLCALVKTDGRSSSWASINKQALASLIDIEVTKQFAKKVGVTADPQMVNAVAQQGMGLADQLPKEFREYYKELILEISKSRVLLVEAGAKLSGQPVSLEQGQQLLQAGGIARLEFEKKLTIDTAARFAPDEKGWPASGNGSVSVPSSRTAKNALKLTAEQAEQSDFLSSLPASQRCGG